MRILCNKQEFADLISGCNDADNCLDCALKHYCTAIDMPPGSDGAYAKLANMCEIIEEEYE